MAHGSATSPVPMTAALAQPVVMAMPVPMATQFVQMSPAMFFAVAPVGRQVPSSQADAKEQKRQCDQDDVQARKQQHDDPPRDGASLCRRRSQQMHAPAASSGFCNSVACTVLPSGGASVRWDVELRRFTGRDATVVSPAFIMDLPAFGAHSFKVAWAESVSKLPPPCSQLPSQGHRRRCMACRLKPFGSSCIGQGQVWLWLALFLSKSRCGRSLRFLNHASGGLHEGT